MCGDARPEEPGREIENAEGGSGTGVKEARLAVSEGESRRADHERHERARRQELAEERPAPDHLLVRSAETEEELTADRRRRRPRTREAGPTPRGSDEESEAGCIMLLDDADAVQRKFKRAVTDSGTEIRFDASRPAINNLLTIYHLLTGQSTEAIERHFDGHGYAKLKSELADITIDFLKPLQQRVRDIDDDKLNAILKAGAERARDIASDTLAKAKTNMGLIGAGN